MPSQCITKRLERHTVNISVDTFLLLTQDAVYFNAIANLRLVNSNMPESIGKISKHHNPNLAMVK